MDSEFNISSLIFVVFSLQVLPLVCPIRKNVSIVNNAICYVQKDSCYHESVSQT